MAIYLCQHGKSVSKDVDPARGLTAQGAIGVQQVAAILEQGNARIDTIQHSGKERAKQTAEIFAARINLEERVKVCKGIDPLDDVIVFAKNLDATTDRMYVGHLPFMQRLVSYLIVNDVERPVVEFQNGGVVCLDYDDESTCWAVKWMLVPELS